MNTYRKYILMAISVVMISFMGACTVVVHDHPHHHPHHGPVVHEDIIVR